MAKYLSFFRISFVQSLKNYKALIGMSIFLIACLVIFSNLWKVAASRVGAVHFTRAELLWYIAFNEWILISIPQTHDDIEEDLRSGRLAYLIPRPISYLGACFSEGLGLLTANLSVLGLVTFVYTYFAVGSLPFDGATFLVALGFGFLAGCLGILLHMLIGLSAFWIGDIQPFTWIFEKLLFIFGGLILPLSVYPKFLQTIAEYTPFPLILGGRSSLVFYADSRLIFAFCLKFLFWTLLSIICLYFVYRRGLRIVCIEGG